MQCTPIVNGNALPSAILYRAEERPTTVSFADGNALKIIRSLNVNKAHSHYISRRLLKIVKMCDAEVVKPFCGINQTLFQFIRKVKQSMVNYHPVSLLPICGIVLEKNLVSHSYRFQREVLNDQSLTCSTILKIVKMCDAEVVKPFCGINQTLFQFIRKVKQSMVNYHPVSLLPICGKCLKKIWFPIAIDSREKFLMTSL